MSSYTEEIKPHHFSEFDRTVQIYETWHKYGRTAFEAYLPSDGAPNSQHIVAYTRGALINKIRIALVEEQTRYDIG